jgi:peptidoglycan/xylan/chitin deacetylase (PgdA/CDA1 family)
MSSDRTLRIGTRFAIAICCLTGLAMMLTVTGSAGPDAAAALPQTVVSLTFDDGDANQYQVRTMLSSRGMHATFYLNSPAIGNDSSYMTWPQIANLYADGNEIAGHTAYHVDLTAVPSAEAQREVCYDRSLILSHGYPATDFAFPFGTYNPAVESIVQGCGYNSARTTDEFGLGCAPTPCAEAIPPVNAYQTRIAGAAEDGLAALKQEVTLAEKNGGGWVQFLFHDICNGCSDLAISAANFQNFLNFVQGQAANNVVVKTVAQVIGGPVQPAVAGPPLPPAPNGSNATVDPSLEQDVDGDGVPDCFFTNTWGNQNATWTRTTDAHTGSYAENVTISGYSSGSDSLLPNQDLGQCTPTVTPGHQYRITEWYKSNAPVSFDLYYRKSDWSWGYTTSSGSFPASSTWTQSSWVTPTIPSGVNGAIAGLNIAQNGFLTVDDLSFDDASPSAGDSTPPTSAVSCNGSSCASGFYGAPVSVTLAATDNPGGSGVARIVYTTDGSDPSPTNGTVYSGAFTIGSTATVKYRAYDNAGNAEAIHSQTVQVDTTAPATGIVCNGAACANGFYNGPVSVTLGATDNGGSGVAKTVYTTDGSDPSPTNGTVYGGAFTLSTTATVKYRSYDVAGNAEQVNSMLVQIVSGTPTTTIACNGTSCSNGWYAAAVSVTLQATDAGGPGVSETVYTADGSDPTLANGTVYNGAFTVGSTTTLKFRSWDSAGNAEPVNSRLIQIDTAAPASSITCNGGSCSSGWYTAAVTVALQATDSGGSGVAGVIYTTDGSDPSPSNGAVYSGAFTISSTSTIRYRAYDGAGNAEAINSQTVQVDAVAPTSTISCNGAACSTGWHAQPVTVALQATDAGGSGVATIVYTTDGSAPSATNGTVYSGAFTVGSTAAVEYRSFDVAGNAEATRSQVVQVDTAAPTVSLAAPAANAQLSGPVAFSATASDNVSVARVDFLVDGSVVGSASSAPYTYSWSSASVADGGHAVQARAVDEAGNTTTSSTTTVTVANNTTPTNLLQNPDLEQGSGNTPTCWLLGGYGTNTPTWTWTTDAYSGSHAESLVITSFTNGDRKLLQAFNATCATPTSGGHQYTVSVWYKSTARSAIFAFASTAGATGPYSWWAQSLYLPAAATWTLATWTTPVVPSGFTYISTGMGLQNAGSLTMDDFSLVQVG